MSKEYQTLATQIIALVGGKENVANVYHCQTRLRFTLVDNLKADTEALEKARRRNKGYYQCWTIPNRHWNTRCRCL